MRPLAAETSAWHPTEEYAGPVDCIARHEDGSLTVIDWNGGAGWTPMGDVRNYPFTGQFQGQGKTIAHLFIDDYAVDFVGLFGVVGSGGQIAALGLTARAEIRALGRRFLVAGWSRAGPFRPPAATALPAGFRPRFQAIPEAAFRDDISSTELRVQGR